MTAARARQKYVQAIFWLSPLILACGLRGIGLDFGLPHMLHPDEGGIVQPAFVWLHEGKWVFGMWKYPPTMSELTGYCSAAAQGLGLCDASGCQPHQVLLTARTLSALAGVASVGLVFHAARIIGSRMWICWLVAMLLAVSPLHLQYSRYAKPDILAVFAITLVLVGVAHMWRDGCSGPTRTLRYRHALVLAGASSGLAAACKYNAGIILIAPVIAVCLSGRPRRALVVDLALVFCVCAAVFALPLVLAGGGLEPLYRGLRHEWLHYQQQGHGGFDTQTPVRDGFRQLAWFAWGVLPTLAAVVTVVPLIRRRASPTVKLAVLLVLTWVCTASLIAFQAVFFARLTLPWLPLLALWTALGLEVACAQRPGFSHRWVAVIVCALVLGQPLWMAVRHTAAIGEVDTRIVAGTWIRDRLPPESYLALMPGSVYGPAGHARRQRTVLRRDLMFLRRRGFSHLVYSGAGDRRYADHSKRFPEQAQEITAWRDELDSRGELLFRAETPTLPGSDVFGVTIGLYHQPTIEVYAVSKRPKSRGGGSENDAAGDR